ncbi:MAG: hypothetical protein BZY88_16740 [SAR202 cluster bacterium Io17-Chloro-G9]|nr:MAG: hypothetical protein BZY88_16740 [SAR202 cluster bacterium Io17-Chloro-G9]
MSPEQEIRRRIQQSGAVTFAEFMDVALFWPRGGYYSGPEHIGASGDYYTSPHAHPAFGALLAHQLFQMWQLLGSPDSFTVVEMGAGAGLLCHDLVSHSAHLSPDFQRSLRYVCLDRRPAPGAEIGLVEAEGMPLVARAAASGLPMHAFVGCVLSNELLDSHAVHQVTVRHGNLREVHVGLQGDDLVEIIGDPSTPALAARLRDLGIEMDEGQTAEINLGLGRWAREVAQALVQGFVLTIDYGHRAEELYSPERRRRGTLTTFHRHTQTDAPFRHIGSQDITSHVDFTSVAGAGRREGLEVLGFGTQRQFLSSLGLERFRRRLSSLGLRDSVIQANRAGMLDLARPGGLGDFKVLVQGKGVGRPAVWGFGAGAGPDQGLGKEAAELAQQVPVPLLTKQHLSVLEGRYPHTAAEFEGQWPAEGDPWSAAR